MTQIIDFDGRYLKAIANCSILFIGLLGSAQRKEKLLQSLGNEAARISDKVFGPVGLDIGAETLKEIALSIMAGIHSQLSGRSGGQLNSGLANDLHECIP